MQPLEVEFGTSTCDPFSQSSDSGRSLLSDVQRRQMNTQQHCFQQQQQKQQHDEQQQLQQHHEDDHGVHFKTTDSAFQDPFDSFHPINLDGYDSSSSFGAVLPSKGKSEWHECKTTYNCKQRHQYQLCTGDLGLREADQVDFLDVRGEINLNLNSADVMMFFDAIDWGIIYLINVIVKETRSKRSVWRITQKHWTQASSF